MTTTTITLKFPVTVAGNEYKTLDMRRCKVRDRRLAGKKATAEEQELALIANLCEVPPEVLDELDSVDYKQLQDVLSGFFGLTTPN